MGDSSEPAGADGTPGRRAPRDRPAVVVAVSVGGMAGALARYGLGEAFPRAPGGWPWMTWGVNVSGALLIGALMVLINEVWTGQRWVRPLLGVGVLGGFTTFSTAVLDAQHLVIAGAPGLGLVYLLGTAVAALIAVFAGSAATRWAVGATS